MVRVSRTWILLLAIVLVTSSVAASATRSPASSDAGTLCKLKGQRYSGRTSQGKPLCFTIARTGKISEYAYGYRDSCGAGTVRTTARSGIAISAGGSFASTSMSSSFFKGRVKGSTASGTFRQRRTEYGLVPPVTCDSGLVRWTAKRKS